MFDKMIYSAFTMVAILSVFEAVSLMVELSRVVHA